MKKLTLLLIGIAMVFCLSRCSSGEKNKVLLSRTFPTMSWERFDYIRNDVEIKKASSFDLVLDATFDPSYTFDNLSIVFTIFDPDGNPFRSKAYQFGLKDREGAWKSTLVDGCYHFSFPLNSELSLNEPGSYCFEVENHMSITPLYGIKEISIKNN